MAVPAPAAFRALVESRLAALRMSKYRLAQLADVHPNTVSRWWRDVTPGDVTLRRIAPILGVSADDLMRAAGRLDQDRAASTLDAEERELLDRAEEFKAGLRGIPRPFWAAITSALTAAGARLAETLPANVTDADLDGDTAPTPAGNESDAPMDDPLRPQTQPRRMPIVTHHSLDRVVTLALLGTLVAD